MGAEEGEGGGAGGFDTEDAAGKADGLKPGAGEAGVFLRGEVALGADGEEQAGGVGGGAKAAKGDDLGYGMGAGSEGGDEFLPIGARADSGGEPRFEIQGRMDFGEPRVAGLFAGFEGGGAPAVLLVGETVGVVEAGFGAGGEEGLDAGGAEFGGLADDVFEEAALGEADGENARDGMGMAGEGLAADAGEAGGFTNQDASNHAAEAVEQLHAVTGADAADAGEVAGFGGVEGDFAAGFGKSAGVEGAQKTHEGGI